MATLWTICGACRGVGKTHLSLALCELLPDAVYAKLGHHQPKPGKPANLFRTIPELESFIDENADRRHIVVEANAPAANGRDDIIIYVDAAPGREDIREDREELMERSHVVISQDADMGGWHNIVMEQTRLTGDMAVSVCSLFVGQKAFLFGPKLRVRSKIWFEVGGERVFGSGLAQLLENIDRLGSLSEAAKAQQISYRKGWGMIKEAKKRLGKRLVIPQVGGAGGGKCALTEEGRRMIEVFNTINRKVAAYADGLFSANEQI